MKPHPLDEIDVVRRYRRGELLSSIAADYDTTPQTIGARMRKLGETPRDRSAKPRVNQHGYVTIFRRGHPMARPNGDVLLHRLVMAESLGRALEPHETVHHIDGNKLNNELSNLQLRTGRHGKHGCYECAECGSRNIRAVPLD